MLIRRLITYSILSLVALGGFFGNIHIETEKSGTQTASISYEGNGVYAFTDLQAAAGADGMTRSTTDDRLKPATNTTSADQLKMWNSVIDALNIILGIITAIVSPAIMFAGWLMSPDWTSGDLFGLRTPMYSLWVTVSNIVYFVYAILLILIALGTMFGQEKFSYKVMLPKLALGILMVPFTWWFVQWTISLSAVVTASVISIPAETLSAKDGKKTWASTESIPKTITIDENTGNPNNKKEVVKCTVDTCISPETFLKSGAGMYGYMMVYAYSVFKFDQVTQIPQGLDILKTGLGIVHQGIVAAIMFLVFGLLTLALVAMLLVRAIKLWVYAIFSPLFTFQFVAGSAMMGENKDTFTIKEFVGLCFVPAIVGLSLSFGLILINAISSAQPGANTSTCTVPKLKEPAGCELVSIMGNTENSISRRIDDKTDPKNPRTQNIIKFGGVTTTFNGKAGASTDAATLDGVQAFTGVLNSAGGVFGTLIIDIIALVFIWLAFMAAKNVSKAVSMAVKPFEDIGKQVGSLASSIPKYTPIPGLGMSANSMAQVPKSIESAISSGDAKRFEKSGIGKLLNADKNIPTDIDKKIVEALKSSDPNDYKMAAKYLGEYAGREGSYNSESTKALMDLLKGKKLPEVTAIMDKMGVKDSEQIKKVYEFANDNNKNELKNDIYKKEFMGIISNAVGKGGAGAPGTNGVTANKVSENVVGITIAGTTVQINKTDKDVAFSPETLAKIKDKELGMKESEFRESLLKTNTLTEAAISDLTKKLKANGNKFTA